VPGGFLRVNLRTVMGERIHYRRSEVGGAGVGCVQSYVGNAARLVEVTARLEGVDMGTGIAAVQKTVADLKPPSTLTARVGTTGAGATNLVFTLIAKDILGLNIQNVRGYRGAADAFLAQQRGELDGQVVGLSSAKVGQAALYNAGFLRPLIAFARTTRFPDYPDVPTGRELAANARSQAILEFAEAPFFMALPVVAPPDLPPERARALQEGFMAMTRDPAFIEDANRMSLEQSPIDGEAVRAIIARMGATPKDVIAQFNGIVGVRN